MAWIDELVNPSLPYKRVNGEKYFYTSSQGKIQLRYIMTWFRTKYPAVKYKALCAMCGCMNGESALNPANIYNFQNYSALFSNRMLAFGICQFIPGCLPRSETEEHWQNYHGTNRPILYYYLKNHGLGSDINTLYTNTGYATDLRVQLQYICDQNGWKRQTIKKYNPVYNKTYSGNFTTFLYDDTEDLGNTTAWFYAGFIRSGTPSSALPSYIRGANGIYSLMYNEFGGDSPKPPDPDPDPPGPDPDPEPTPPGQSSKFIIIAKASGLF